MSIGAGSHYAFDFNKGQTDLIYKTFGKNIYLYKDFLFYLYDSFKSNSPIFFSLSLDFNKLSPIKKLYTPVELNFFISSEVLIPLSAIKI